MHSMTYGELPTEEQYDAAWDRLLEEGELRGDVFHFGNDPRMGTCALTQSELWKEIQRVKEEYESKLTGDDCEEDPEVCGGWLSNVLFCLGFEWV